jgi:hypothetical protein
MKRESRTKGRGRGTPRFFFITMKRSTIYKKFCFYQDWYKDLTEVERTSPIGSWIKTRVEIFHNLLLEIDRNVPIGDNGTGNYKYSLS